MPETNFFWDPLSDNILQERDETGAVTAEYTAEPGLYGNIISQNRGGVESLYHFDANGNTMALTADDQAVTDSYAYTAFGDVTQRTGTTVNPFQFAGSMGYYVNPATGDLEARARPFRPSITRWMSPDPLGVSSDANLYRYSLNNPQTVVDPSGQLAWKETEGDQFKFTTGNCGKYSWHINWDLSKIIGDSPDGYILQRVEFAFQVKDCCDKTKRLVIRQVNSSHSSAGWLQPG
jgi:RHS repeat-associated protein